MVRTVLQHVPATLQWRPSTFVVQRETRGLLTKLLRPSVLDLERYHTLAVLGHPRKPAMNVKQGQTLFLQDIRQAYELERIKGVCEVR